MKGVELSVNTLIIMVLGVIILVAIIALVLGVWSPSSISVSSETVKNSACVKYIGQGCKSASSIDVTLDGKTYTFDNFCKNVLKRSSCDEVCGCSAGAADCPNQCCPEGGAYRVKTCLIGSCCSGTCCSDTCCSDGTCKKTC